ncbi:MAG: carboxylate--amine ligase [Spirochaetes bacterium RBG_16_49_21]|nr:MAG: carboxylate--amine ligase [Spirochaetes bacterium RBG_16_49_21]
MEKIIKKAIRRGQKTLSEYDSKQVIQSVGIPITREKLARSRKAAVAYANEIGYPVVLKGCSDKAAHKTEMGLVKLNLTGAKEVRNAYDEIIGKGFELDGVLVQEMIRGEREFVIGLSRDPQFGPCVMFGIGGIFTEVIKDVSFRVAPITEVDAEEMLGEIRMKKLLDEFRGSPAVDRNDLINALVSIGDIGYKHSEIAEIDINPLIIRGSKPVVADALVVLSEQKKSRRRAAS